MYPNKFRNKKELEDAISSLELELRELQALHYKLYTCKECHNIGFWILDDDKVEYCNCKCGIYCKENGIDYPGDC